MDISPKKQAYANQAAGIINKLNARKMEGYYCATVDEAKDKLQELLARGDRRKVVSYGGSMTLDENGFKDVVTDNGHELIVRENYTTEEELKECKAKIITSDVFLMSTNAITLDGELINIDARGNRVSFLIYGPDEVIVIAGMNKVVTTVEEGINRTRNIASPANTVRLKRNTPCATTGRCAQCLNDSICCNTVITRLSVIPNRIKVILVGEELGY